MPPTDSRWDFPPPPFEELLLDDELSELALLFLLSLELLFLLSLELEFLASVIIRLYFYSTAGGNHLQPIATFWRFYRICNPGSRPELSCLPERRNNILSNHFNILVEIVFRTGGRNKNHACASFNVFL